MPASASITIYGVKTGLPFGSQTVGPLQITNTASGDYVQDLIAVNGDNTVTVPSWAVGVIIAPPAGNVAAWKLKQVAGDTGTPLHLTNPLFYSFPATQASFILNIAGTPTFVLDWF